VSQNVNGRLEGARTEYREALEAARACPTPEAWARLLAAGKALSSIEESPRQKRGRKSHRETDVVDLNGLE
jgi:hypothetical protein